jgi:serine/threonine protein kinase
VRLFDDFDVCGPNGKHEVFVMEVTGPTLEELMDGCYNPDTRRRVPLPPQLVRRLARQLLLALEFLASEGVLHGGRVFASLSSYLLRSTGLWAPVF